MVRIWNTVNQPQQATPEQVILFAKDPYMGVTAAQYRAAHDEVMKKIYAELGDKGRVVIEGELLETMQHRLATGIPKNLTPMPPGCFINTISHDMAELVATSAVPQPGSFHQKRVVPKMANKNKNEAPPLAPTITDGLALLHAEAFAVHAPAFLWEPSTGKLSGQLDELVNDLISAGTTGEVVPIFVPAPIVVEVKNPLTGKTRKHHAFSWLVVTAEWDGEMGMALLRLPDDSELEYVPIGMTENEGQVRTMIVLAVGNALMDDDDRERIRTEGAGLTHLMRVFWEKLALPEGTFNSLVLATMTQARLEEETKGMERVR